MVFQKNYVCIFSLNSESPFLIYQSNLNYIAAKSGTESYYNWIAVNSSNKQGESKSSKSILNANQY